MANIILLEERDLIYDLFLDIFLDSRIKTKEVHGIKYHHNRSYYSTSKVAKHGILSMKESYKLGLLDLTEEELKKYSLEDHINGIDHISLASTEIDYSKVRKNEFIYCPISFYGTDILISNNVKARRVSTHYYNEFLVEDKVLPEEFRALDIRILKEIRDKTTKYSNYMSESVLQDLINKYNNIRQIAMTIIESNLDIPFREMSFENITLDTAKIASAPILMLK